MHKNEPMEFANPRVVFVDDNVNRLEVVGRAVEEWKEAWCPLFFSDSKTFLEALSGLGDAVIVVNLTGAPEDGAAFYQAAGQEIVKQENAGWFIAIVEKQRTDESISVSKLDFDDFIREPFDIDELAARVRVGLRQIRSVQEVRKLTRSLEFLAAIDPLTGLYHRRHGNILLEQELGRVRRGKQHLSAIMLDIDNFAGINDAHGRGAGDRVLEHFAALLRFTLRNYDIPVRWGGDEFLVICPHTSSTDAITVAERLTRHARDAEIKLKNGRVIRTTVSLGTCNTELLETVEAEKLVSEADRMMYLAKFNGGNRAVHSDAGLRD